MKIAHAPPGHHSVIGRPSVGGLSHAEYVIYRGEQVRLAALSSKERHVLMQTSVKSSAKSKHTFVHVVTRV